MKSKKTHLQLFLMFVVVTAVLMLFSNGNQYFGKSYYESESFDYETSDFLDGVGRFILNPLNEEDYKKILEITEEEIEYYRSFYGTLAEQIKNIQDQYEFDPEQDAEVVAALKKERDEKIAEVKKNFEDDAYVTAKIQKKKQQFLNELDRTIEERKQEFEEQYSFFAYAFTNEKTGEVYRKGSVEESSVYKYNFNGNDQRFPRSATVNMSDFNGEYVGLLERTYHFKKDLSDFSGTITIPKSVLANTDFGKTAQLFKYKKYINYGLLLAGIISFILLIVNFKPSRKQFILPAQAREFVERIPLDIALAGTGFIAYVTKMFLNGTADDVRSLAYLFDDASRINVLESIFFILVSYVGFVMTVYLIVWLWERITQSTSVEQLWEQTLMAKISSSFRDMFYNRTIGMQSLVLLLVIFLGGFGLAIVFVTASFGAFLMYSFLFILFFIPILFMFMRRMGYLNKIMKHTEDMANGRLTNNLKVKGSSPLAKHAENLNGLREGVRSSLNEQAKSERMKTELITNVSHDLRTPLTSIITYTDLLKNPDITEAERAKYIAILDTKSARLKTLIEDLFEVSKMASGNIEISKQRIDLAQLLQQATGEHGEDYAAANLDLRVNISEQPIFAYVDGQKWWRVIDNLIINACKYSLEGTRVYVNLKMNEGNAELTVKNVAKYELHEDATELIERFKRADTSRHTEGSGLGLAIAQSIVDLHGGVLDIAVDGDLFKVTVSVKADK